MGLALCAFSSLASAAPTVPPPPHERESLPPSQRRWYGWQTLSVDGGAMALGLTALALASSDGPGHSENVAQGLVFGSAVAYAAGGPTVHLIHHRPWQALGSFGLRAGLPFLTGTIGLVSQTCPPPDGSEYGNCGLGGLIAGVAVGAVLAMVLDDSLLAWERPRVDVAPQARLSLAPVVASDGRRELRLLGTF